MFDLSTPRIRLLIITLSVTSQPATLPDLQTNQPSEKSCWKLSCTSCTSLIKPKAEEITSKELGPVVQSIVSLTSSLKGQLVKCFTTLLLIKPVLVPGEE